MKLLIKELSTGERERERERVCVCVYVSHSVVSLFHPVHSSQPGSSVHGILQARMLEWVAELVLKLARFPQTLK